MKWDTYLRQCIISCQLSFEKTKLTSYFEPVRVHGFTREKIIRSIENVLVTNKHWSSEARVECLNNTEWWQHNNDEPRWRSHERRRLHAHESIEPRQHSSLTAWLRTVVLRRKLLLFSRNYLSIIFGQTYILSASLAVLLFTTCSCSISWKMWI